MFLSSADFENPASRRPCGAEAAGQAHPGPARARPAVGASLASLAGDALAQRFCGWKGASGRRYVATIHRPADAAWMEMEEAVVLIVALDKEGRRSLVSVEDAPSPLRRRALQAAALAAGPGRREVHLHLLAATPAARTAAAVDLISAGAL